VPALTRAPVRRATWLTHSVVSRRERPIGPWAFAGVAVASFGGPLALAALIAPGLVADASDSAGVEMLAAVVVFAAPLAIWLRYSRHVAGSGGLYSFVEAAAGRRVALVQAAIWTFSYLLYVIYTTVQIVYDVLPVVLPGERRYQTVLALLIPVALAAVIIAGRAVARARRGTPGRRSRAVTDGHPRGERGGAVLRGRPGARP
jgi:amino acid transporter